MKTIWLFLCACILSLVLLTSNTQAQNKLNNLISIRVKAAKLATVLDTIAKRNGFYFSYSNDQLNGDSLVSLNVHRQPLRTVLDTLFEGKVDFKEAPGYVILRLAPNSLTMQAEAATEKEQTYFISGYVLDERTGLGISGASVYEKKSLAATLTDAKGFFKIRIKAIGMVTLTVSKELYRDASINFLNDVTISLKPDNTSYDAEANPDRAEKSWLGKMFISSAQKMQTINLGGYFKTVPFQTSFTPGLSSHGMMSGQVVNHFSLNALGGYTAGLDGVEMAGLFNINKQYVRYLQLAGLFNVVGGNFSGLQIGGIGNNVNKRVDGLQLGGIYNIAKNRKGFSMAGIANLTLDTAKGLSIAGILNKAKIMNGFSFALVNIADTLNGYALGLLNFSYNGYHQLMVYSNDLAVANIGFKTGNQKLYALLSAGINPADQPTYFTLGLGLGHEFILGGSYKLAAEFSTHTLMARKWSDTHNLNRLAAVVNYRINAKLSFFAGPAINLLYHAGDTALPEQQQIIKNKLSLTDIGRNKAWIGWTAGFSFL
jgi:hypothetical protein